VSSSPLRILLTALPYSNRVQGLESQYETVELEVGDVGSIRQDSSACSMFYIQEIIHPIETPLFSRKIMKQLEHVLGNFLRGEIRAGSGQNSDHFCSKKFDTGVSWTWTSTSRYSCLESG
jgi:hypothetical protein